MIICVVFAVYADGSICLDILQNRWSPTYDVSSILTSIQVSLPLFWQIIMLSLSLLQNTQLSDVASRYLDQGDFKYLWAKQ